MPLSTFDPSAYPAGWRTDLTDWATQLRAEGIAETTLSGYALHLGWLARDLAHLAPTAWDISPELLTGWLDAHKWAIVTRRKVLGSLRNFYAWAIADARTDRSPLAGVAMLPARPPGPATLPIKGQWAAPAEAWTRWMRASSCSPTTIRLRRFWLRQLAENYANPWTVTADDLARMLSRDDLAPETKRAARGAWRAFYHWAEQAGHLSASPATALRPIRLPRTVPRPVTDEALDAALTQATDRTRLVLMLAALAGLRRNEIAQVHTSDIGPDTLRVVGKGGHERLIPLHPELAHALHRELRSRRDGHPARPGWPRPPELPGWLFPSVNPVEHLSAGHIGKLIDRTLPTGYTPHQLRHRFATQAYAAERDLRAVQELLGHASPTTTIRYAAVPSSALVGAVAGVALPRH